MGYFYFKGCDDSRLAELHRRALLDQFDHCPFSKDARTRFHQLAAEIVSTIDSQLSSYRSEHDKLAERLDGMKQTCKEHQASQDYLKLRDTYERFDRDEIPVGALLKGRCDVSSGY